MKIKLEQIFKLQVNNTTIKKEFLAGFTTFITMAYIIFVNPQMMSQSGMDEGAIFVGTCLAAALACIVMGLYANWPVGLAPGMGLNAFFTYTVVGQMGYSWEIALGAVFLAGILFFIMSITRLRRWMIDSIPLNLRIAMGSGVTVAKKLAYHYQTLENLQKAEFEDLITVDEIGDRIAQSVISWFKNVDNLLLIRRLNESGVQLKINTSILIDRTNTLQGKSFVISGVFKNHSRDELKSLIDKNSGKNTSSISKKTSYLIAGENMGPSKREKAEKLGIPIISEDEFLSLLQ